jgi:hypothetical protein
MRGRFLAVLALAIPIVFAALITWTLTGSVESAHFAPTAADVPLAVARPVSGAQVPATLVPNAATIGPTVTEATVLPSSTDTAVGVSDTPTPVSSDPLADPADADQSASQPIVAPKTASSSNATTGHGKVNHIARAKRRD